MGPDHFSASDGFVITMLLVMLLGMGVVGLLLLCMKRNAARRDPHVDRLLEEMEEAEKREASAQAGGVPPKNAEPWEREADWWKE